MCFFLFLEFIYSLNFPFVNFNEQEWELCMEAKSGGRSSSKIYIFIFFYKSFIFLLKI